LKVFVTDINLVYFWIRFGIFVVRRVGNTGSCPAIRKDKSARTAAFQARRY